MKDGGDGIEDVDWNAYVAAGGSDVKITRAIRGKLSSQRSQDLKKSRWNAEDAVGVGDVWELMRGCGGCCYQCGRCVLLQYRHKRDPRQWSLDRVQNDVGHVRGNCVIACLGCNLRRGTEEADFQRAAASLVVNKIDTFAGQGECDDGDTYVHSDKVTIRKYGADVKPATAEDL